MTGYERASGRLYSGKITMCGECVVGYLKTTMKGRPQWTQGIWLSKTAISLAQPTECLWRAALEGFLIPSNWRCYQIWWLHAGNVAMPILVIDWSMQSALHCQLCCNGKWTSAWRQRCTSSQRLCTCPFHLRMLMQRPFQARRGTAMLMVLLQLQIQRLQVALCQDLVVTLQFHIFALVVVHWST